MNRHALDVIQYPAVLEVVAGYAGSTLGAAAVRALQPQTAFAAVDDELRRVDQMTAFLLRAQDWAMPAVPDARAALQRLGISGSRLDGPSLRDLNVLLHGSRLVRRAVLQHRDDYPLLSLVAEPLSTDESLEERLRRAIDEAGDVRDEASRELTRLRRELRGARARIVQKLEQFMASLPERYRVLDASVSVREGRYVVPIRREGRSEVGGLVHDESATGATLFVEPPVAVELMNRLRELERAEAREVQRILGELTDALRPHRDALAASLDALVALDSLQARSRYALQYDGRRPDVVARGERGFAIVNGRHPLLLAGDAAVVPFDLALDGDERTLLISGPNTGGKTVLLKAIGLISALAQAGIVPPVGAGTKLPLFADIYADIGDEQSIEASLSTFSAHLKNLREILNGAEAASLVLIDEIGSGTDPAEGGALAEAILVELTSRGTTTVATTHLGQLKTLAGAVGGVVNASLQFDAAKLRPTYRLKKGLPGRSYGLAIARRLGFPNDLLERADTALPRAERDVAVLLEELERRDRELAEAGAEAERRRSEAEALRGEAESLRARLEEREAEVARREKQAERRARQQARDLLLNAREEVERAVAELREAAESARTDAELEHAIRTARRRVERQARRQLEKAPVEEPVALGPGAASVDVGARVRIVATGAEGTVTELREGRVVVDMGGPRVSVGAGGVVPVETKPDERPMPRRPAWGASDFEVSSEIDLRGLRADEVETRLLPALDAAIQAALPSLRVIHGKGTGALRQVVREVLGADPRIRAFRPGGIGEGGSGVTVVELS